MPSLVLTGWPSVGKTTFAKLLADRAIQHRSKTVSSCIIVNEELVRPEYLTKSRCYASAAEEKVTRSALKTEFDRHCSDAGKEKGKTLVILDSSNYIKGYRYELHCIAKAAGERHGVVWVMCPAEVAKLWNRKRRERWMTRRTAEHEDEHRNGNKDGNKDGNGRCMYYETEEEIEELMQRYEPPDARNRWDKPLYRVDVSSTLDWDNLRKELNLGAEGKDKTVEEETLNRSVYDMHSLGDALREEARSSTVSNTANGAVSSSTSNDNSNDKRAPLKPKTRPTVGSSFKRNRAGTSTQRALPTPEIPHVTTMPTSTPSPTAPTPTSHPTKPQKRRTMIELADEILDSFLLNTAPLKEGLSTKLHANANANVLHLVDGITRTATDRFLEAQGRNAIGGASTGGTLVVSLPGEASPNGAHGAYHSMTVHRTVSPVEIQRLRRQYVQWVGAHPPKDCSEAGVARSFLSYVESRL